MISIMSFNQWLAFVLDEKNMECLGEGYEKVPTSLNLGFMSFRYLCYATLHPFRVVKSFSTKTRIALRMLIKRVLLII